MQATETTPAQRDATQDDLDHVVCCHAPDRTFCGLDATLMPFTDDLGNCVVCDDLWDAVGCPYGLECPPEVFD